MKGYASKLRQQIVMDLAKAAYGYLHVGLSMFYDLALSNEPVNPQVALGNIAIGVELTLKYFVAQQSLLLLFKELPLETRILLLCSDGLPATFNWRAHDLELKSTTKKIIEFSECATVFFAFFPDQKQSLKTHLDALVVARNSSIHSALPSFHNYELERAAYVALRIVGSLGKVGALPFDFEIDNDESQKFLRVFEETKLKQVYEKLEGAKENAKKLTGDLKTISLDDLMARDPDPILPWARLIAKCPICGSDAILAGYTEVITVDADSDHPEEAILGFFPDRFQCDLCGLKLNDYDELRYGGVQRFYERDESVDEFNQAMKELAEAEHWDQ